MDKLLPTLVIAVLVALVFAGFALGWRARQRRQASLPALAEVPAELGETLHVDDGFYVATTKAEAPTDRIAVAGLGWRGRAGVTVATRGILLSIAGGREVFIPSAAVVGVGRATWTIDRVVGRDGLVFVRWTWGEQAVDTYLRPADPDALTSALTKIAPTTDKAAA